MEQSFFEPVELTDTEIDEIAGGAAAAAATGDVAAAALAGDFQLTIGPVNLIGLNAALAIGLG
jgi:hypothetical protein